MESQDSTRALHSKTKDRGRLNGCVSEQALEAQLEAEDRICKGNCWSEKEGCKKFKRRTEMVGGYFCKGRGEAEMK